MRPTTGYRTNNRFHPLCTDRTCGDRKAGRKEGEKDVSRVAEPDEEVAEDVEEELEVEGEEEEEGGREEEEGAGVVEDEGDVDDTCDDNEPYRILSFKPHIIHIW